MLNRILFVCLLFLVAGFLCRDASAGQQQQDDSAERDARASHPTDGTVQNAPTLRLSPGDELDISVYGVPDLSQHGRITTDGRIYMSLLGYIPVAGLTVEQAQERIRTRLVESGAMKHPHVTVYVKEFALEGVSVVGEVNKPGIYPVQSARSLMDVLLLAGGLTQKAGTSVIVRHRDQSGDAVTVKVGSDLEPVDKSIAVLPGDVITVPKGEIVYLLGGVTQPGGYIIPDDGMNLLELFAKASGPVKGASLNKTTLIRKSSAGTQETKIALQDIMRGKSPDVLLKPDDIVYIPAGGDRGALRSTILQAAGYALIFRP